MKKLITILCLVFFGSYSYGVECSPNLEEKRGIIFKKGTQIPFSGLLECIDQEGNFTFRESYKNGRVNGISELYWSNGKLMSREFYKDGVEDGLSETFNEEGNLLTRGYMKNGKEVGVWYIMGQKIEY